jgi:signal transduction histidine kinase
MPSDPPIDEAKSQQHYVMGLRGHRADSAAGQRPVRRRIGGRRSLWLVWALLVLTIFITGGLAIWYLRQNALASSQREMRNLGVVLAEQTSRSIQSVDLIIQEVQAHISELGPHTPEEFSRVMADENSHQFLAARLQNLPQADAISLVDADGSLLNWSRTDPVPRLPRLNLSDRDYFRYLRDHNDPGVLVSGPVKTRITNKWVMFIVRRINGPRGMFLGLAVGLIQTQYLEDFYATISILPGEYVTLVRRDGIVVAGQPDIENRRGKQIPVQSPWYDRVADGGGSYRSPGYFTGLPSIIMVHPLHDYPLVVDVNMSEQAVLKSWQKQAIGITGATISVALGFTALFWIIAAQFRRLEDYAAELVRGADMLRARESQLHDFAEISSDWFWEQDADLRFCWMSQTSLFGLAGNSSYVGKTRWELAGQDGTEAQWMRHRADLAARRPFRDFRYQYRDIHGELRHISASGLPVFDETRRFLGYRGTARDVTVEVEAADELRRSTERAEASNRAKSEFLANMSHELRTPLNAIIGFSELIHDQKSGGIGGRYVEWAADILASGRHLLDVINNVLELSRLEAGRYDLSNDRVDLAMVVRDCLGVIRLQAEKNQVRLDCAIADNEVVLRADFQAVKRVLLNLLTNAVKFTPAGGVVPVHVERPANGDIAVIVADTGIGIDPSALDSLCKPFTQADPSIGRRYGGAGLGLAISRKLMELHGGELTIESTVGQGTTVRLAFSQARVISISQQVPATAGTSL